MISPLELVYPVHGPLEGGLGAEDVKGHMHLAPLLTRHNSNIPRASFAKCTSGLLQSSFVTSSMNPSLARFSSSR